MHRTRPFAIKRATRGPPSALQQLSCYSYSVPSFFYLKAIVAPSSISQLAHRESVLTNGMTRDSGSNATHGPQRRRFHPRSRPFISKVPSQCFGFSIASPQSLRLSNSFQSGPCPIKCTPNDACVCCFRLPSRINIAAQQGQVRRRPIDHVCRSFFQRRARPIGLRFTEPKVEVATTPTTMGL